MVLFYLELQSDLKGLVRVLQGFKGHVRVAREPRKVHRHHWRRTRDKEIMVNLSLEGQTLKRTVPLPHFNYMWLTLRASVPSASEVTVAAWASTVVVAETEAVGGAHGVIAGQVVHTRCLAFPGGHGWGGSGGGQRDAKVDQKRKNDEDVQWVHSQWFSWQLCFNFCFHFFHFHFLECMLISCWDS